MSYIRKCPTCSTEHEYFSKFTLQRAIQKNTKCSSCCLLGNQRTKNVSPPNKGKYSNEIQRAISNGQIWNERGTWYRTCPKCNRPTKCSSYYNAFKRISNWCHACGLTKQIGRTFSVETRKKQRISAIKRLKTYQLSNRPNFNRQACKFIDSINSQYGWNLQHALNGGEVWIMGYYPDGYDKTRNIWFEYDEKSHKRNFQKLKDLERQEIIIREVCPAKFIRYDEVNGTLHDILSNEILKH